MATAFITRKGGAALSVDTGIIHGSNYITEKTTSITVPELIGAKHFIFMRYQTTINDIDTEDSINTLYYNRGEARVSFYNSLGYDGLDFTSNISFDPATGTISFPNKYPSSTLRPYFSNEDGYIYYIIER